MISQLKKLNSVQEVRDFAKINGFSGSAAKNLEVEWLAYKDSIDNAIVDIIPKRTPKITKNNE